MRIVKYPSVLQMIAIFLLAAVPACRFDYPFGAREHELGQMWPDRDGYFWVYEYEQNEIGPICIMQLYEELEDVPDFPALEDLAAYLDEGPFIGGFVTRKGWYELAFKGMARTESGAVGKNLESSVSLENYYDTIDAVDGSASEPFLRQLALYRPDLREKLASMGYVSGADVPVAGIQETEGQSLVPDIDYILQQPAPLFLRGGVWEKTDEYIGLYGDLDRLLAWKFLEEDLSVGHEFTHQLVPTLADDVFLHCRVLRRETVRTASGVFTDALVCLYAVDYGIGVVYSFEPMDEDYYRMMDYGTVTYAPGSGPIHCYERLLVEVSRPEYCCVERILEIRRTNAGGFW